MSFTGRRATGLWRPMSLPRACQPQAVNNPRLFSACSEPRAFSGLLRVFPASSGPRASFVWASAPLSQPLLGLGPLLGLFWASAPLQPLLGVLGLGPLLGLFWASAPLPSLFWASGLFWVFSGLLRLFYNIPKAIFYLLKGDYKHPQ